MSFFKKLIAFLMSVLSVIAGFFSGGKTPAEPTPVPLPAKSESRVYYDAAYGTHERQRFDLVLPQDATGDVGLILFIHGGAWVMGAKDGYRNALQDCANLGYAAAAINYRYLSDTISMKEQMQDIDLALAQMQRVAQMHELHLTKTLLTGSSAGGHLSLLFAYKYAANAAVTPACVVSFCGPTNLIDPAFIEHSILGSTAQMIDLMNKLAGVRITEAEYNAKSGRYAAWVAALQSYSPLNQVTSATVPTVICHGEQDNVVPFSNATDLDAALTAAGVTHEFVRYPNSGHGLESDPDCAARADALLYAYANTYLH